MALAKNALKRFKTLRHPGIVAFMDGAENDNQVIIGTEPVTPLTLALGKDPSLADDQNFLALGLYKIASAVKFLNSDVQMTHGFIRITSIYITKSGEWRLGGLDVASNLKDVQPILVDWGSRMPDSYKYSPPECGNGVWSGVLDNPVHCIDSWGFGCLLYEVFNNTILPSRDVLTNVAKIPKSLLPHYKHLLTSNPKARHDVATVLERSKVSGYFVNEFIGVCSALEEFSIKDSHEKDQFLNKLNNSLETFPADFCKHKILPELIKALEFGGAGSKALTPILKIGNKLDQAEFDTLLVPILVKMFALPDRAIRVSLCENLGGFIDKLNPRVLNDKIFPHLSTGFSDTNAVVRECSLRSVLLISPKLNERIVNNDLLRFLAKLQGDEEPGIRANTTICLGKLAPTLTDSTRKKVLIPAFSRALHDTFPPTRNAGLLAFSATVEYYSPQEIATKVIPANSALLLDPERHIRTQAFKNLDMFLGRLKGVSDGMGETAEVTVGVNGGGTGAVGSSGSSGGAQDGWAGWAVGALGGAIAKAASGTAAVVSPTGVSGVRVSGDAGRRSGEEVRRSGSGVSVPSMQSNSSNVGVSGGGVGGSGGFGSVNPNVSSFGSVGQSNGGGVSSFGSVGQSSGAGGMKLGGGGMSLKPKLAAAAVNVEDWNDDWEQKPKVATVQARAPSPAKGAGWDDDWDAQSSATSIRATSPMTSFGAMGGPGSSSGVSSFGGMGTGSGAASGASLADREAEKQRKREQLALLREQKKAAIAAKKQTQ
ncbi:ARM repeat-containing protein [Rhizoclosmatium globosum]|uniref:ARM repeat-containing protein n=1 Tax=Rhizoclosmatium globosum TaxID=329046 RepID=A0A1Y2C0L9_9FUNG|nr:ARM repeat-containing protein [Rhizoclosmatium globosum]|eukprot:ORY40454.1 ARM repeat-containing protein [Rhizoclosmatium globosum]